MSRRVLDYIASLQSEASLVPNPEAEKRPMSFWKYEMFTTCPLKFKKTILERRSAPSDFRNALEGSVLHAVMEKFVGTLNGGIPDWAWPERNFDVIYAAVISDPKITRIGWKTDPPARDQAKAYDLALRMVKWSTDFLRETGLLDSVEVHAELPYKVRLLSDLYISGRVDLWVKNKSGLVDVYDWKGVADITRPKSAQMKMYALGLLLVTGCEVNKGVFICPQVGDIVGVPLTDESLMEFVQNIIGVADQIKVCLKSGRWSAEKNSLCKWCAFKEDPECRELHSVVEKPQGKTVAFG